MPSLPLPSRSTARFAAALAVVAALFVTGVVAGAAGSTMIIGSEANNAGSANTQLLTNSSVVAFKLLQNGPGTALMGYATAGFGATRGVYGRVDSANGDGVQARNAAAGIGTGSALHAYGQANIGIIAESTGSVPLKLIAPGGMAPFSTNSSTKVTNLNADKLDGLNSTELMLGTAVIPSGTTVTGAGVWDDAAGLDNGDVQVLVPLPARTPVALDNTTVNFAPDVLAVDDDSACTGTADAPTAPSGKVCIYILGATSADGAGGYGSGSILIPPALQDRYFLIVFFTNTGTLGADMYLRYTWAYTAP